MDAKACIEAMERTVAVEVGRGIGALIEPARGGLLGAARDLASADRPHVAILTVFYIPFADTPAAETDGPPGAVQLARALDACGIPCRIATDRHCAAAVQAAIAAGAPGPAVGFDILDDQTSVAAARERWRALTPPVSHVIAIERCGPAADGRPYNARGRDIGRWTVDFTPLFTGGPWTAIGIGDGGNELGMGSLPAGLIAETVPNGATLGCAVPADHLIVGGVSNWGAWALALALAVLRADLRPAITHALDIEREQRILDSMVRDGPAIDGILGAPAASVDGLDFARHREVYERLRSLAA